MPARKLEVRLMAAVLLLAWVVVVLLLLVDGQLAPLALVAAVPAAICGWLLIGPRPVTTGGWIVRAIGVLAGLVTAGLAILLAEPLVADGRSLIHPSAEMNYAALLALSLTVAYSARHVSLEPGRAVAVFGVAVPALVGGAILISADRPVGVPDECLVPLVAPAAEVTVSARSEIDGEVLGEGTLSGARHAADEQWSVALSGHSSPAQTVEMIVSDGRTWLRHDGADWQPVADSAATGGWLDRRLTLAISHRPLPAMEDLGLETLDGVTMRRCRIYVDGVAAATAVPLLAWLAGAEPPTTRTRLDIWRGELDWWLGRDGRLEHATIIIGGLPADAWRMRGMRGLLMAEMWVSEPSTPPVIEEPVP